VTFEQLGRYWIIDDKAATLWITQWQLIFSQLDERVHTCGALNKGKVPEFMYR
jgi:hypothetical protein